MALPAAKPLTSIPVVLPDLSREIQVLTNLGKVGNIQPNPAPQIKVNINRLEASVLVLFNMEPTANMTIPMPADFLTPIRSAVRPAGIASPTSIRNGMAKSMPVSACVSNNSSLIMCSIGGTHIIDVNRLKYTKKALTSIFRGMITPSLSYHEGLGGINSTGPNTRLAWYKMLKFLCLLGSLENGEPQRNRTSNLLIKSQLLCQLS